LDEAYQVYINRMARLTLPATYQTQVQNIQKSPKYEGNKAIHFPGYSVVSPPGEEDVENVELYRNVETIQQQIKEQFDPGFFIPIPDRSFHLTVADLIWDSAYKDSVIENPDFDRRLQKCVQESFEIYQQAVSQSSPAQLQLTGLILLPRALTVALVPKNESDYEKILQLRRAIYQNRDLIALGIEQQYYFTGHITLGYFGNIPANFDRARFSNILTAFTDRWLETDPQFLCVRQVQLRKFDDMTSYRREPDWAVVDI
jgi:hypothetical protein